MVAPAARCTTSPVKLGAHAVPPSEPPAPPPPPAPPDAAGADEHPRIPAPSAAYKIAKDQEGIARESRPRPPDRQTVARFPRGRLGSGAPWHTQTAERVAVQPQGALPRPARLARHDAARVRQPPF